MGWQRLATGSCSGLAQSLCTPALVACGMFLKQSCGVLVVQQAGLLAASWGLSAVGRAGSRFGMLLSWLAYMCFFRIMKRIRASGAWCAGVWALRLGKHALVPNRVLVVLSEVMAEDGCMCCAWHMLAWWLLGGWCCGWHSTILHVHVLHVKVHGTLNSRAACSTALVLLVSQCWAKGRGHALCAGGWWEHCC